MDLSQNTPANAEFMVDKIIEKLRIMNIGAVKASHFNQEMYEELRDIYEMVMKKTNFTPRELEAIAEELGSLRNI
ncbi:uncharacterized protein YfkK (UPF0435 family) [Peribacillus deserti]|uniref:UPF0435 protein JOC77_003098 n=1 Tax=Peribacillus deserti TaxID=673318 RepID=A0ABS2QKG4_9BACI|nr:DUF1128 domain-containing protein [Peribacillus deserti]MBM7693654.1 uncharacterized protein YfkK (UPF0435 family) [Peribacillus deserti]